MGRRAKSFTQAERAETAKEQQKERRRTSHGKELVRAQRYAAYHKVHGRQGSSTFHLPQRILDNASMPLPEDSYLFRQALRSTQLLDETGLDLWDTGPPYPTRPPSNSRPEREHTRRLVEVMHGRQLRKRNGFDNDEAEHVSVEGRDKLLEEWRMAIAFLEVYDDNHRELTMARLWLQWLARDIYEYHRKCLKLIS